MDVGMDYQLNEQIDALFEGPGLEYRSDSIERLHVILKGLHPAELVLPQDELVNLVAQKNKNFPIPAKKLTKMRIRHLVSSLNEDRRAKRLEELKPEALEQFDRSLAAKNFAYLPAMRDALSGAGLRDVKDKDIEELVDQRRRDRYETELNKVRPVAQAAFDEVLNLSDGEIERFGDMGAWRGWQSIAERVAVTSIATDYPVAALAYLPRVEDKLTASGWDRVDSEIIMELIGPPRLRAHAFLVSEAYYIALSKDVARVPQTSETSVSDTQMKACNRIFQQSGLPDLTKYEFDLSRILSHTRFMRQDALHRAAHLVSEPARTSQPDNRPTSQPGINWQPDKKAGFHP